MNRLHGIIMFALAAGYIFLECDSMPSERGNFMPDHRDKRPFCNAFTGCGKKRAIAPPVSHSMDDNRMEESLGSLLDLNSEPAVEDLMRQIMSEAKLWEAIQEANRAMYLEKQMRPGNNRLPVAFSVQ